MQKVFQKIIEKLEEEREQSYADFERYAFETSPYLDGEYDDFFHKGLERATRLVKQVAGEYKDGWIPCSDDKPKESGTYNVTAYDGNKLRSTHAKWQKRTKSWILTGTMAYWKVIAWKPLSEPYQPENVDGEQERAEE